MALIRKCKMRANIKHGIVVCLWLPLMSVAGVCSGTSSGAANVTDTSAADSADDTGVNRTDRRTVATLNSDREIEVRSASRVSGKYGESAYVNVASFNRLVLLTGQVPDAETRADIQKLASSVPNVKAVANQLVIGGISSCDERSNDALITSKVKGRFLDSGKLQAQPVKIITEAGTVFLMGLVTKEEANFAVEIARVTAGVQKVVRVLEVIRSDQINY